MNTVLLLLLGLKYLAWGAGEVKIKPMEANPGLLYDPFKKIHLIREEWQLISSINVEKLVNLYPDSHQNLWESYRVFKTTSAHLEQAVNQQLSDLKRTQLFSMAGEEHIHLMTNHLRTLNNAEKAIEDAKWGKLTYLTVSAKQLYQATADITKKHPTLNPPQPLDHMDITALAKVSRIETGKANGYFLIIITVPLLDQTPWLAYELKSLPKPEKIGDKISTLTIQPTSKYLVSEASFNEYYFAEQDHINNCKPIGPDIVCPPDVPSKTTERKNEVDCEMKLLMDPQTEVLRECNIRIIKKCKLTWIKMNEKNTWAYSTCKEESIQWICPGQISERNVINGTGLLHVQQGCQVSCNGFIIRGIARESTKIDFITPSFNLSLETLNSSLKIDNAAINSFTEIQNPANVIDEFEPWGQGLEENEEKMSLIALDHQKEESNRKITIGSISAIGIISVIIGAIATHKIISRFLSKRRQYNNRDRGDEKAVVIQLETIEEKKSNPAERSESNSSEPDNNDERSLTTKQTALEDPPKIVETPKKAKSFRLKDYKSPF
ncbi:Similar to LdOrf-130: Envelope fusion protein (Lymantria dispar multicapsid nuclear polyhedrosis virus) [Cotesia congregata]|uniref:Similar to LdOrf-130: Envelope fusion protein (Lymantria dispar multicapsid nuclear polyhedrosis virus) n=1 Tax=Cotesia congregata TaxID=51543 RepID=A0A8J2ELQ4_COTCN|nr:Similar to LdOrf-130: Envelope fusion protein (Lymantria dispar multicapsid nuclear polyhedrosis virus) [Cotesia congregata]